MSTGPGTSPKPERKTIAAIRGAVRKGVLKQPFRRSDVSLAIGWSRPVAFLPKHRVGNPDDETELFHQLDRGLYELVR